jgi:hydroxylamine reductase (hybrid-cluster protein)
VEILNLELHHLSVQLVEEVDLMMEELLELQEDQELEQLTDHLEQVQTQDQELVAKEMPVEMVIDYNLNLEIEEVVAEKLNPEVIHLLDLMDHQEEVEEMDQIILQHTELNTVKMEFLVAEERDQILVVMALLLEELAVAETHHLLLPDPDQHNLN